MASAEGLCNTADQLRDEALQPDAPGTGTAAKPRIGAKRKISSTAEDHMEADTEAPHGDQQPSAKRTKRLNPTMADLMDYMLSAGVSVLRVGQWLLYDDGNGSTLVMRSSNHSRHRSRRAEISLTKCVFPRMCSASMCAEDAFCPCFLAGSKPISCGR